MGFLNFLKNAASKLNPFRAAEAKPAWAFAAVLQQQRIPLEQVLPKPQEPFGERPEPLSPEAEAAVFATDEIDSFVHFGTWLKATSSNVHEMHYDADNSELQIRYLNGGLYSYAGVSIREAEAFARAASKGRWVWRNLRKLGTVFGFNAAHPYTFLSGVSNYQPQWFRKASIRALHGKVGPEGERSAAQLMNLMPRGWHRAAAKFRR